MISPHELLRLAYISHRSKTSNDDLDTYQRMVKPARLAGIGKFIDDGIKFPTNIVVNIKADSGMQFDHQQTHGDTATGLLSLPGQYGSAWVIDGQHRLYGFAYAARYEEEDRTVVSVLAYENLPIRQEIGMFIDINTQQVKVSRNLVNEIVSSMNIDDPNPEKRLDAMFARLALQLDLYPTSPIRNRVLTVSQEKDSTRCLTLTSLADGIEENGLLGFVHRGKKGSEANIVPGPLTDLSGEPIPTIERAVVALSRYLSLFAEAVVDHWQLGDSKGGYLCTNLGLRALLSLLKRLVSYVERRDEVEARLLDPEDIIGRLAPLVKPVTDFFATANLVDVTSFRGRGSSLLSVAENRSQMEVIIHEAIPAYAPKEVIDYMASRDLQGTKQAKDMIDEINRILYDDVISELKAKYGETKQAWWTLGVPKDVRNSCDKMFNDNNGEHDRWQYLFLSNYPEIIVYGENWDLFKGNYQVDVPRPNR